LLKRSAAKETWISDNNKNEKKMTERELKLLLNAHALKHIQISYAVMAKGYMIVADGYPLETSRRETRRFKTLDTAAKFLFKIGIVDFAVKLKTS
jgi:hypothetical protein